MPNVFAAVRGSAEEEFADGLSDRRRRTVEKSTKRVIFVLRPKRFLPLIQILF